MAARCLIGVCLSWLLLFGVASAQDDRPIQKLPTPDQASLERAERTVKELFKAEYAKKFQSEMLQFANTLVSQAQETKDDPASRYVLYRDASILAAKAGEFAGAIGVLDELGREFETDIGSVKLAALKIAAEKGQSGANGPFNNRYFAEAALFVFPDAIASSDPKIATELLSLAETGAKKASNDELIERVKARQADLAEVLKQFTEFQNGQTTLVTKPDDPNANTVVGRFLCFIRGDWNRGLPMLERCGDEKFRSVAARDLGKPTDPGAQVHLADDWMELAESQIRAAKRQISGRAAHWYREAMPKVTGITYTKARDRAIAIYKEFPGLKDGTSDGLSIYSQYRGLWQMRYANNTVRHYVIDSRGNAYFLSHGGIHRGHMIPSGKYMNLVMGQGGRYGSDKIEFKDGELHIAKYNPAGHFVATGIGTKRPMDDDGGTLNSSLFANPDKSESDTTPLAGIWAIQYSNGVIRTYIIGRRGAVVGMLGEESPGTGRLTKLEESAGQAKGETRYFLDFKDDRPERVWLSGGKLRIDHFNPASLYPNGPPSHQAIGVRLSD